MNENVHVKQFVRIFITLVFLVLVCIVIVRNAWVTEDAYITFRTVDNFINGYGLTWNVDERVQAYTNPLWMFLLSGVYFFTREIYFSSIYLSIAVSMGAIMIFAFGIARSWQGAVAGIVLLGFSKAFIDFSTGGLENPLIFFFMALFFLVYFRMKFDLKSLFLLSLIAGLSAFNRMDTVLFYIFPLFHAYTQTRKWVRGIIVGGAGFIPFVLWLGFALFYYGFPFPNTAYAKLNTGISDLNMALQGINYFINSYELDPITLITIVAGIFGFLLSRKKEPSGSGYRGAAAVSAGIIFYLFYIVKIGGDFMSGRFFAAPLFCAVINFCACPPEIAKTVWVPATCLACFVGLQTPLSPVYSNEKYYNTKLQNNAIADERGWYYACTGYLIALHRPKMPTCGWAWQGRELKETTQGKTVMIHGNVGLLGYFAGTKVHFIDFLALADPLLSRINIVNPEYWRIGHFARHLPVGYYSTIVAGKNMITNKRLAQYYDKLSFVISGKLFDLNRVREIINLNTGKYDSLLSEFRTALIRTNAADIGTVKKERIPWDAAENTLFSGGGIHIKLKKKSRAEKIEVSIRNSGDYEVLFFNAFFEAGASEIKVQNPSGFTLSLCTIDVPPEAVRSGYTSIRIIPKEKKAVYSIGYFKSVEAADSNDSIRNVAGKNKTGTDRNDRKVVRE